MKVFKYIIALVVIVVLVAVIFYIKATTVKYEGINLDLQFMVTKHIEGNNISLTKIPPDGTIIIISKSKKESSDVFFKSLDLKVESEIPVGTKILTANDGSQIYLKISKLREMPQIVKLYGYIERKSLSFSFYGNTNDYFKFIESLRKINYY